MLNDINLPKKLRFAYVLGNVIIGLSVGVSTWYCIATVTQQCNDAEAINEAGRQRMWSQRVASDASQIALALTSADQEWFEKSCSDLKRSIQRWHEAHNSLTDHAFVRQSAQRSKTSTIAAKLDELEATINIIASEAIGLTSSGVVETNNQASVVAVRKIIQLTDAYLVEMDELVNRLEVIAKARVNQLANVQIVVCGIISLVVLLVALTVHERSISVLSQCIQTLVSSRVSAEKASAAKAEFLANMSHEIRTPMTAILGFTDLALAENVAQRPEETVATFQTIQRNATHLMTIINDILDVSKIEANKLQIEEIEFSISDILFDIRDLVVPKCESKGVRFELSCDGYLPDRIISDPTRLRQILFNAISNSIKFTETGSVSLRVSYDQESAKLHFQNIDTGIGMTDGQLDAVRKFVAFSQADSSTTRKFGGTGLGLKICHQLCGLLGGSLAIDSKAGKGTTMEVTIHAPMPIGTRLSIFGFDNTRPCIVDRPSQPRISNADLNGISVLVAEDGLDNQRIIRCILEKSGAAVCVVDNGQAVVDAMKQEEYAYDIVLMDMQMPIMDGFEATASLRALGFSLPIIALTASALLSDRRECLDIGCDEFVSKPIDWKRLVQVISDLTSETCRPHSSQYMEQAP